MRIETLSNSYYCDVQTDKSLPRLVDLHQELYLNGSNTEVHVFSDTRQHETLPHTNINQHQAAEQIIDWLGLKHRILFGFGPMQAGKGRLTEILKGKYGDLAVVLQHIYGEQRHGPVIGARDKDGVMTQTAISAQSYTTVSDLIAIVDDNPGKKIIADEIHFVTSNRDSFEADFSSLDDALKVADSQIILLGLDFTALATQWPNTKDIINIASAGVVMAARCDETGREAFLTQRMVREVDGTERPTSVKDPVVIIGDNKFNLTGERYFPVSEEKFRLHRE